MVCVPRTSVAQPLSGCRSRVDLARSVLLSGWSNKRLEPVLSIYFASFRSSTCANTLFVNIAIVRASSGERPRRREV